MLTKKTVKPMSNRDTDPCELLLIIFSVFIALLVIAIVSNIQFVAILYNYRDFAGWASAFGTLVLAFIAVFQDRIHAYIKRPILNCNIELKPPDCHKTTMRRTQPFLPGEETSNVIYDISTYYIRFRILNSGASSAEKVEVIITDIFKKNKNDTFVRINSFSSDNLVWSILDESNKRKMYWEYISPSTYKYCNLGHILDPKYRNICNGENNTNFIKDDTIFSFDVYFRSNILYYLVSPGTYRIKLKVGCTNAKTISKEYELNVTGKWFEDELKMLNEGISIKEIH